MAEEQYFLKRRDAVKGPFSLQKLQTLLAEKKLKANDLVGASNDGPWERMTAVHKTIRAGHPLELTGNTIASTTIEDEGTPRESRKRNNRTFLYLCAQLVGKPGHPVGCLLEAMFLIWGNCFFVFVIMHKCGTSPLVWFIGMGLGVVAWYQKRLKTGRAVHTVEDVHESHSETTVDKGGNEDRSIIGSILGFYFATLFTAAALWLPVSGIMCSPLVSREVTEDWVGFPSDLGSSTGVYVFFWVWAGSCGLWLVGTIANALGLWNPPDR